MTSLFTYRRAKLLASAALLCLALPANTQIPPARPIHRTPAAPAINTTTIFLDPGHGGSDPGAHLSADSDEKDLALAFATQLHDLLTAKGFTVIVSRTRGTIPTPPPADPDNPAAVPSPISTTLVVPTEDQRAEQANRIRPLACLLLHASNGGHGVHLITSSLSPLDPIDAPLVLSWNEAQATSVSQSLRLADDLSTSLNSIRVPLVILHASVPPIDSLTCPAVAIELAPLPATPVTDADYQRRVAESVVTALIFWRDRVQQEAAQAAAAAEFATPRPDTSNKKPVNPAKPTPKPYYPVKPPAPVLPPHAPAPIVRRPPPATPPGGQP